MAKQTIVVDIKKTEALTIMIDLRDDFEELLELVPDYCLESKKIAKRISSKFQRMVDLVECRK